MRMLENVEQTQKHHNGPDYYAILGCNRHSTDLQIMTEYRYRIRQLHPDKTSKQATDLFHKIQNAKDILMNKKTREIYNAWLDCSIDIPWSLWLENFDNLSGLHWAQPVQTALMLNYQNGPEKMKNVGINKTFRQSPYQSSTVKKFRNYEL